MSMPRSTRLAAIAALTAVSMGAGVLTATAASAAPAQSATAGTQAEAPKPGSAAAPSPILLTGQAGWSFKATWFGYITGNGGTVAVADGATQGAGGVVSYPVRHGAVNPAGKSADVRFSGSVTYALAKHGINEVTFANPRVVLKGGTGTLFLDVRTDLEGTKTSADAVPFATLKASASALSGSTLNWNGITAALTEQGAAAFTRDGAPMYEPGSELDKLALGGTASVPTLTVSQVRGLGAETQVTVTGKGYQPGRGVYVAQTIALPGTTYPGVFGNAAYVRKVGADGTFTTNLKLTETFTPSGAAAIDCRTTACFVATFNSFDGTDSTWMPSRAQDVARAVSFGETKITRQPAASSVRSGATAAFSAAAAGADTVRWERSTDRGATWSTIAGAEAPTLSVKAAIALNDTRYRAVFTNALGSVTTDPAALTVAAVPSRITGINAAPEPVAKGGSLTVTGTLQTAGVSDDVWRPLAKSPVVVEFRAQGSTAWTKAASAVSGSTGAFSAKTTAAKDGDWRARYAGTADRAASVSSGDTVDVRLRTGIVSFNAKPEPVRKGRPITVTGTLRTLDGTWKNTSGQTVTIWFQASGSKTWTKQAGVRTNSKGAFSKAFTAKKDGSWKAVFDATSARLGTNSAADHVDVR
ncbi:HtaA domain-containing protein [Streptomyces sp. CAU 1734]|uniref:HtaA domain-containing protein n=1 Tax=Streptomyces sp. CAU 1734 TaxID=3140360 RepID=UPI003260675B